MFKPGDLVTVDFPGATGIKRRPTVVISTDAYQRNRPDVILGLITSQLPALALPSDYILLDWAAAGLSKPSAFRCFLATLPSRTMILIGQLSPRDGQAVQDCVRASIDVG
jgi:mRNA interferase MazF